MLLNENKNVNSKEGYEPEVHNNLGKVKCSTGAKVGYWFIMIITLGLAYLFWGIPSQNKLKKMQMKINEAASGIDIQLEKRFDTLTKIVDAVKSQCKFDKETLENISALRSGANIYNNTNQSNAISESTNKNEIAQVKNINHKTSLIDKVNQGINVAFERYPNLGADDSIRTLINESIMIEKEIAASKRLYNSVATEFNSIIYTFPTNVLLSNKNYEAIPLCVASENKRKDVNVGF